MTLQCKTRASGGTENAGLKAVLLVDDRSEHSRSSEYLQPFAAPLFRVVNRLERRFALSQSHARLVAELAYPMVARHD